VIDVRHLRVVNGSRLRIPSASKKESEFCLIDYAQCPTRDVCWVLDLGSSCESHDGCIVDTN
jgi:hypothetical protein